MEPALLKISDIELGALALKQMYAAHGYRKFKMSHFEELEFYTENRSFLQDDRIAAFSDPSGKVLALRPDVTLSIVKNARDETEKVYYGEYVYRVAKNTSVIDEILQVGLEHIGRVDPYTEGEVVWLAARSLAMLSDDYLLELSHMGILGSLFAETGANGALQEEVLRCIAGKNLHDARRILWENGASEAAIETLLAVAGLSGPLCEVLPRLKAVVGEPSEELAAILRELETLERILRETGVAEKLRFDLSVTSDMSYYNGIVFAGYLNGVPFRVLSGGRYDYLLGKLGKHGGAIGFAVYLGKLEQYVEPPRSGAELLLTYDAATPPELVMRQVRALSEQGVSLLAVPGEPPEGEFQKTCRINGEGVLIDA